jgi:hypothetical protein
MCVCVYVRTISFTNTTTAAAAQYSAVQHHTARLLSPPSLLVKPA